MTRQGQPGHETVFSPLPSPPHPLLHHRQAPRWSGEWAATNSLVQHGETPFSTPIPAPRCTPTATHSRRGSGVLEITLRTSGGVVLGRLGRYPQGTAKPDTENDPKCSPPLRGSGRGWKQGGRFPLHALAGGLPPLIHPRGPPWSPVLSCSLLSYLVVPCRPLWCAVVP